MGIFIFFLNLSLVSNNFKKFKLYFYFLVPEENMAHPSRGTQVLKGEMGAALLDGNTDNYDLERGYTRHIIIKNEDYGILIKLGTQAIINHIKMLLWDRDLR